MTGSEALVQVLAGDTRKAWSAVELTDAGFPLTTGLTGKDAKHTFYMSLYKEAKRPDGLVVRSTNKAGKTVFKLNPKRRALRSEKPAAA
jgi:hypothetical protein